MITNKGLLFIRHAVLCCFVVNVLACSQLVAGGLDRPTRQIMNGIVMRSNDASDASALAVLLENGFMEHFYTRLRDGKPSAGASRPSLAPQAREYIEKLADSYPAKQTVPSVNALLNSNYFATLLAETGKVTPPLTTLPKVVRATGEPPEPSDEDLRRMLSSAQTFARMSIPGYSQASYARSYAAIGDPKTYVFEFNPDGSPQSRRNVHSVKVDRKSFVARDSR
jgi:hypothetical protein